MVGAGRASIVSPSAGRIQFLNSYSAVSGSQLELGQALTGRRLCQVGTNNVGIEVRGLDKCCNWSLWCGNRWQLDGLEQFRVQGEHHRKRQRPDESDSAGDAHQLFSLRGRHGLLADRNVGGLLDFGTTDPSVTINQAALT